MLLRVVAGVREVRPREGRPGEMRERLSGWLAGWPNGRRLHRLVMRTRIARPEDSSRCLGASRFRPLDFRPRARNNTHELPSSSRARPLLDWSPLAGPAALQVATLTGPHRPCRWLIAAKRAPGAPLLAGLRPIDPIDGSRFRARLVDAAEPEAGACLAANCHRQTSARATLAGQHFPHCFKNSTSARTSEKIRFTRGRAERAFLI